MKSYIFKLIMLISLLMSVSCCYAKGYTYMSSQDEKLQEFFYKGLELREKEKYDEALKYLKEAYEINPEQLQVIGEICGCYQGLDNVQELEKYSKIGLHIAQNIYSKDNIGRFYHYLAGAYHNHTCKKYEKAIKYFKLVLYNKPYFTSDYPPLAYSYYSLGKYDDAIELYKKAGNQEMAEEVREAKRNSSPIEKELDLAVKFDLNENAQEAYKHYKKVLELDPNNDIALVRVAGEEKDSQKAIELGEKVLKILEKKKDNFTYLYDYLYLNVLSQNYEKLENYEKSTNYFKLYLMISSAKEGDKAIEEKDYELALKCYKKALENEIEIEYVHYNYYAIDRIINILFDLDDYEEVKTYLKKAIDIAKKEKKEEKLANYTCLVGKYYAFKKEYDKAIKYYDMAYEKQNNLDDKYLTKYFKGISYIGLNNIDKALEQFNECKNLIEQGAEDICDIESQIILYKAYFDKNSNLSKYNNHIDNGKKFFESNQFEKAIDEFASALKIVPQRIDGIMLLSLALLQAKDYRNFEEVSLEGYQISIRDHDYTLLVTFCYNLAFFYYYNKEYNSSLEFSLKAVELNPKRTDCWILAGKALTDLQKYKEAINTYQKAIVNDPDNKTKYDEYINKIKSEMQK